MYLRTEGAEHAPLSVVSVENFDITPSNVRHDAAIFFFAHVLASLVATLSFFLFVDKTGGDVLFYTCVRFRSVIYI